MLMNSLPDFPEDSRTAIGENSFRKPVLKVLGMGGGGCNAVNRMIELGIKDIDFVAVNTDRQVLQTSLAPVKIQIGPLLTRGLGAGGQPEVGEAAAMESVNELKAVLKGADMVFLAAGLGGGTGTGSIPVAAEISRAMGAVTVGIVTMPFSFEVGRRQKSAAEGLRKLTPHTDTLIAISNDRLMDVRGGNITIDLAFRVADDVLRQAVQGVTELVTESGLINVDFSHVKRLMKMGGGAFLAIGQGEGEGKALQAVQNALKHPLLESVSLEHAAGLLVNFTGGQDLTFHEVTCAFSYLQEQAGTEMEMVMGVVNDDRMVNRAQVILIVTGIGAQPIEDVLPGAEMINQRVATAIKVQEMPLAMKIAQPNALPAAEMVQPFNAAAEGPTAWQTISKPAAGFESDALLNADNLDIPAFLRRRKSVVSKGEPFPNRV
jgi:cell division protein FtsZ